MWLVISNQKKKCLKKESGKKYILWILLSNITIMNKVMKEDVFMTTWKMNDQLDE